MRLARRVSYNVGNLQAVDRQDRPNVAVEIDDGLFFFACENQRWLCHHQRDGTNHGGGQRSLKNPRYRRQGLLTDAVERAWCNKESA